MNVERLHRILIDLNKDIKASKIGGYLQQVQSHLQNQVNQPNQPTHQKNLVQNLEALYSLLEKSDYNDYSPSWKEVIQDIGGTELLGNNLAGRIQEILSKNAITPAAALEEIKKIFSEFQTFQSGINNTLTGLKSLKIEEEDLEPGECELGYTIPRDFIDNKLSSLKEEVAELNFILNTISEAVTGEKQEFKVKTISSSNFLLYILIGLSVADILARATERILSLYKQVLEIKHLRNQLKDRGIPAKETKGIETHANGMMRKEIKQIAKEIIDEHYDGENGRKNELENAVVISLNKLANRIDNGFKVEVRVELLPEHNEEDGKETKAEQEKRNLVNSIKSNASKIEFLDTDGEGILHLSEKEKKRPAGNNA